MTPQTIRSRLLEPAGRPACWSSGSPLPDSRSSTRGEGTVGLLWADRAFAAYNVCTRATVIPWLSTVPRKYCPSLRDRVFLVEISRDDKRIRLPTSGPHLLAFTLRGWMVVGRGTNDATS
jgi:hypothetical protein